MIYNVRFTAALRDICSPQSDAMLSAAKRLPVTPSRLATVLASNDPKIWKACGAPPRHAAIFTIASVIVKSRFYPAAPGITEFLSLALACYRARNPCDTALVQVVLDLEHNSGGSQPRHEDAVDRAKNSKIDLATLIRVRERMELTLSAWNHVTEDIASAPAWFAVAFGALDSVGRAFGADRTTIASTMREVLGEPRFTICTEAAGMPDLSAWVFAGGQMIYKDLLGSTKSLADTMTATAKLYASEVERQYECD